MTIKAEPGTSAAVVEVCAHHLGRKFVQANNDFLVTGWFLDLDLVHAAEKDGQVKAVKDIQDNLAKALLGLYSLHPDLRRAIEWQVSDNLANDEPMTRLQTFALLPQDSTDEKATLVLKPFKSHDNLEVLIRTALSSYVGVSADTPGLEVHQGTPGKSAKSTAKNVLSDLNMKDVTYRQRDGETWQKALAVKRCRDFWRMAKDKDAPKTYSGPFGTFLGDIVDALGKRDQWKSLPAVMRAWDGCAEKNEWFL